MDNITINQKITPTVDLLKCFTNQVEFNLIEDINNYARENNLKIAQFTEPKCTYSGTYGFYTWITIVLFEEKVE